MILDNLLVTQFTANQKQLGFHTGIHVYELCYAVNVPLESRIIGKIHRICVDILDLEKLKKLTLQQ